MLSNVGRLMEVVFQVTLNLQLTEAQKININFKIIILCVNASLFKHLRVVSL